MPFDSNGVFTRVMNWTSDQQNGIAIECGRHDQEDDNFAEGFNDTFCRDGRAAATGNFNMGTHKIQNLGDATASTDAVNKGQLDSVNSTLTALISTSISNSLSSLYPVGSIYISTQSTCPLSTLISGSTWTIVGTSVVTGVSIPTSIPVYGNGKVISFYNGTSTGTLIERGSGYGFAAGSAATGSAVGTSSPLTTYTPNNVAVGLSTATDGNSGIVAKSNDITKTTITVNIFKRTA
jgi:hypothetical protein